MLHQKLSVHWSSTQSRALKFITISIWFRTSTTPTSQSYVNGVDTYTKSTIRIPLPRLMITPMATKALRSQVAAKWQESFHRLNGEAPGISGLMRFSEVCYTAFYFYMVYTDRKFRHGRFHFSFCTPSISRTWLSMSMVCLTVCFYVYFHDCLRFMDCLTKPGKDLDRARPAFTLISQSRWFPALLENFLGNLSRKLSKSWVSDSTICQRICERTSTWSKTR
jgi:hypothetical protein